MKPALDHSGMLTIREREEDEAVQRPLEWGLIRRLWTYTRAQRRKRNILIALTVARAVQLPALGFTVSAIISGPVARRDGGAIAAAVAVYAVLAFLTDSMFHFRQRYALELGESVVNALREEIFARLHRMPMAFYHRTKIGRIISRVTTDVESVRAGIQDVLFVSTIQGGQMLATALLMLWCDWTMFLVVLLMAPILWTINRHFRTRLSFYSRASQESFSRVTATLAESVNGIRVTQGFARQETNAGLFRTLLADHSRYTVLLARTSAILMPLLELNTQFFIAVLLMFGGWRTMHGEMEVATIIKFFFLANYFFAPLQVIGNQYNQALISMAGAERVFRLIDAEPDWEDAPDVVELPDPRRTGAPAAHGARVEFRRVTFGYDPARPVLHDINFVAEPGQTVALVGHTGSGKSSIASLVAKFYLPTAGELLIDGRDIRTLSSRSLHRQTGAMQQNNFLFSGTVLENIRLGRPEATEAEVRDALRRLDCADLIDALPGGVHTPVGEKGGGLSLGQRQLVCFARALLADPRLLIFDEATSAIDTITEVRLQRALGVLLAGRTAFMIAHRLSTIRQAHAILVLEAGRIVERGTHRELVARGGVYAGLHRQFLQGAGGV